MFSWCYIRAIISLPLPPSGSSILRGLLLIPFGQCRQVKILFKLYNGFPKFAGLFINLKDHDIWVFFLKGKWKSKKRRKWNDQNHHSQSRLTPSLYSPYIWNRRIVPFHVDDTDWESPISHISKKQQLEFYMPSQSSHPVKSELLTMVNWPSISCRSDCSLQTLED